MLIHTSLTFELSTFASYLPDLTKIFMKKAAIEKLLKWLSIIVIVSILFLPPFRIKGGLPAIELVDMMFPFIAILLLFRIGDWKSNKFYWIVGGFAVYVGITIVANGRLGQMRDYFEIFKLLKFGVLTALFGIAGLLEGTQIIKRLFIALVVVNLMQYFNVFNFNYFLSQTFPNPERYLYFGLDSAGHVTGKRMLGLAMNPNNNAIIFLIFSILFLIQSIKIKKNFVWFFIALVMVFLCQSRTAMVSAAILFAVYAFLMRRELKLVGLALGIIVSSFSVSFLTTKYTTSIVAAPNYLEDEEQMSEEQVSAKVTYLESVVHGQFLGGSSMEGRFAVWKHLWGMIKEKPIFGHAPFKEYFYDNEIYSENEYILMTWRYGFIGLLIYVFIYLYLAMMAIRNIHLSSAKVLLLTVVLMMVTALTNNPFSHQKVLILFALIVGSFFWERKKTLKQDSIR